MILGRGWDDFDVVGEWFGGGLGVFWGWLGSGLGVSFFPNSDSSLRALVGLNRFPQSLG